MHTPPARRFLALPALALVISTLVACGGATASPSPQPTAALTKAADAAALVIATNPVFTGATELSPDIIGASRYWEATPLDGGGYTIVMTVGWGDCQAGCIERRVWTYEVAANGQLKLVSEVGDPLPADLPA